MLPIARTFLTAAALVFLPMAAQAQDNVVNVYNWSDYIGEGVLEDFTKETGIKVVYDTYDSMEMMETKLLAGGSGYDIIVPTDRNLARLIQAGVVQKLDKSKLPNLQHQWPAIAERSGTPPAATSTVKPPAENPNAPMRSASRRCRCGHCWSI